MAAVGDEEVVFDADAAEAGDVDAGLDGDDVAGLENGRGVHGIQTRVFVAAQAHAVAEAVAKKLAVAGAGDVGAGDGVDLVRGLARGERCRGGEVGVKDDRVDVLELGRPGAEGEGPSMYVTDPEGNVVEFKGPPGA